MKSRPYSETGDWSIDWLKKTSDVIKELRFEDKDKDLKSEDKDL